MKRVSYRGPTKVMVTWCAAFVCLWFTVFDSINTMMSYYDAVNMLGRASQPRLVQCKHECLFLLL